MFDAKEKLNKVNKIIDDTPDLINDIMIKCACNLHSYKKKQQENHNYILRMALDGLLSIIEDSKTAGKRFEKRLYNFKPIFFAITSFVRFNENAECKYINPYLSSSCCSDYMHYLIPYYEKHLINQDFESLKDDYLSSMDVSYSSYDEVQFRTAQILNILIMIKSKIKEQEIKNASI